MPGDTETVTAVVFVRRGRVPESSIYKAALEAVRDTLPIVYDLKQAIASVSDVKTLDGVDGRDYEVTFTYRRRRTTDDDAEVEVDKVLDALKVPTQEDFLAASKGEG